MTFKRQSDLSFVESHIVLPARTGSNPSSCAWLRGPAVWHLPSAQGVILESWDRAAHPPPCLELAFPLPVSLPVSLCVSCD